MPTNYDSIVLGCGPVGYWPLDEYKSGNEYAAMRPYLMYGKDSNAWMEKTVTFPSAGVIDFEYFINAYYYERPVQVFVDGVLRFDTFNVTYPNYDAFSWRAVTIEVPSGTHTIRFYSQSSYGMWGALDLAAVRRIRFGVIEAVPGYDASSHQYWRISIGATSLGTLVGVAEVEFRALVDGALVDQTGTGTVTASTEYNSGHQAAYAFDNNAGTPWASSTLPAWLQYNFGVGNGKSIVEVGILPRPSDVNQAPSSLLVQYSDNALDWTTVASWNPSGWQSGVWKSFPFNVRVIYFEEHLFDESTSAHFPEEWDRGGAIRIGWIVDRMPVELPLAYEDKSGNGQHGLVFSLHADSVYASAITPPTGAFSTYFYYARYGHIRIPDPSVFDFEWDHPFSISYWARISASNWNQNIFGKWMSGKGIEVYFGPTGLTPSHHQLNISVDWASGSYIQKNIDLSALLGGTYSDTFHHYTWTYDGSGDPSGISVYVDGVLRDGAGVTTTGAPLVSGTVRTSAFPIIGAQVVGSATPPGGHDAMNGYLSGFALFDRVLVENDVKMLAGGAGAVPSIHMAPATSLGTSPGINASAARQVRLPAAQTVITGGATAGPKSKLNPGVN